MKVSIITPSLNQADFLERAIRSVWMQKGDFDLEHIVADGGSNDGSVGILQRYDALYRAGSFDFQCRNFTFNWWSRQDSGQSSAINLGFKSSSGKIIGWLNSDDIYLQKNSLESLLEPFIDDQNDIVVGNGNHIDENDLILDKPLLINQLDDTNLQRRLKYLPRYNFILQPATLFRRKVWESCPISERYHYVMDWIFWIEACEKGFHFHKVNTPIAGNRLHIDAKTVEGGASKYREGLDLFDVYNVWSANRLYYYLYLVLLKFDEIPLLKHLLPALRSAGKNIRNLLINKIKFY